MSKRLNSAMRISLTYAIVGGLWIVLSDSVLAAFVGDAETLNVLQTYKGWFYVLITTLMLYGLVSASERSICASEATARALLNAPADTILLFDTSGVLLDVNETAVRSYARPREELIGLCIWDLYPPDVTERRKPYIDQVIRSGESVRFEDEREETWFDSVLYPIFDERQEVGKVAVIARDITERKRAVEALRQSEAKYRALIEWANDGFFTIEGAEFTDCNQKALKILGRSREEVIGYTPDVISPPTQPDGMRSDEKALKVIEKAYAGESQVFEWVHTKGDGTPIDVEVSLTRIDIKDKPILLALWRDITERKRAEALLRESEERYRSLFDRVPVGLYRTTSTGQIVDVNPAIVRMLGYPDREALLVINAAELYVEPDDRTHWQILIESEGIVRDFETRMYRHDGTVIWVQNAAQVVRDNDGKVLYYEGSLQDISDRKQAERELRLYTERLEILYEIDQGILNARSPETIAGAALSRLRQLVSCQRAGVTLIDFAADESVTLAVDTDVETRFKAGTRFQLDSFEDELELWRQGQVVVWGEPLSRGGTIQAISAAEGLSSAVGVPMIAQGELIGSLNLSYSSSEPGMFTQEHELVARQVADQLAIAIQQARLQERVQRHATELERQIADRTRELLVLYEVAALASQSLDLETTLARSLEQVLEAVGSDAGVVHLLDRVDGTSEEGSLRLAIQQGLPPALVPEFESLSSDEGLGKWVIEQDAPLILPDITSDPRVIVSLPDVEPFAYIGVPMRVGKRTLGMLSVIRGTDQPPLYVEEIALLTSIADQLGVVVESVQLRDQAERAAVLEERGRLARDLHDSVTQLLYTVNLFATAGQNAHASGNQEVVQHSLDQLGSAAQQALKELRLMLYELRPPMLEHGDLVEALQFRLDAVEGRVGVTTHLLASRDIALPGHIEQELYHIVLEALNNALKHARATSVTVSIDAGKDQVELTVADDGRGFDLSVLESARGFGLSTMRERAERLGGELTIDSVPGDGTQIRITVPVTGLKSNDQEATDDA